ncbi:hypothetical protein R69776_05797 [Paraburkholderia nemoris]|uniref:Uncharacterized protein n=1 Tax=Paraburkholderia nemoris TaxID=2793076 RepID=A0ABN7MQ88_9BURK|nr:hypothetical protein R75777_05793 [Paraburkholderia nemoris]CAE6813560.1 hypothetical protein R69776_05797 [Paraburkholderia nemoris]
MPLVRGRRNTSPARQRHPVLALCQSAAFGRIDESKVSDGSTACDGRSRWFAGAAPFMV